MVWCSKRRGMWNDSSWVSTEPLLRCLACFFFFFLLCYFSSVKFSCEDSFTSQTVWGVNHNLLLGSLTSSSVSQLHPLLWLHYKSESHESGDQKRGGMKKPPQAAMSEGRAQTLVYVCLCVCVFFFFFYCLFIYLFWRDFGASGSNDTCVLLSLVCAGTKPHIPPFRPPLLRASPESQLFISLPVGLRQTGAGAELYWGCWKIFA